MSKGRIEIDTVFYIVLGLIAVLGISFLLLTYGPEIGNFIVEDIIKKYLSKDLFVEKAETLKAAIECSYYRCFASDGCEGDEVKNIWWYDSEENEIKCKDFCGEDWQDSEHRICDQNALQYPIELEYEEEGVVTLNDFEVENTQCIVSSSYSGRWKRPIKEWVHYLWVENKLIDEEKSTKEDCEMTTTRAAYDFRTLGIEKTNIYIYSYRRTGAPAKYAVTKIWTSPEYLTFKPDTEEEIDLPYPDPHNHRIVVEKNGGIISDSIINVEYIYLDPDMVNPDPGKDYVRFKFKCSNSPWESPTLHRDDKTILCNGLYELTLVDISSSLGLLGIRTPESTTFKIKYLVF